jgi:hypothetical protein
VQRPRLIKTVVSISLIGIGLLWYVGALKAAWYEGVDFLCHINFECARLGRLETGILLFKLETGRLPHDTNELFSSDVAQWHGPYAKQVDLLDLCGKPILYLRSDDRSILFRLVACRSGDQAGADGDTDNIIREVRR